MDPRHGSGPSRTRFPASCSRSVPARKVNSAVCHQSDNDKRAHYPAGPQGAMQGHSFRHLMQVHSFGHLSFSDGGIPPTRGRRGRPSWRPLQNCRRVPICVSRRSPRRPCGRAATSAIVVFVFIGVPPSYWAGEIALLKQRETGSGVSLHCVHVAWQVVAGKFRAGDSRRPFG